MGPFMLETRKVRLLKRQKCILPALTTALTQRRLEQEVFLSASPRVRPVDLKPFCRQNCRYQRTVPVDCQ
jgi:hypothetical protein